MSQGIVYKIKKNEERREIINQLKLRIDQLYADEKIKPEKLEEYTNALVIVLQKTSEIEKFGKVLAGYMPKYNELKHFNAQRIANNYYQALQEQEATRLELERRGPLNLTFTIWDNIAAQKFMI